MKHRRRLHQILWVLLSLPTVLLPAGCRKQEEKPREGITIGFVMDSFVEERWTRDRDIFLSTAKALGAEVILQVAEENPQTQEAQVYYLLEQGIDALVLIAADPDYLSKAVQETVRRGIPVLLYERIVRNAGANLLLAYDGVRTGELQAKAVMSRLRKGTVVILNGKEKDANANAVHQGVMNVLTPLVEAGSVKVLSDFWTTASNTEEAAAELDRLLQAGKHPDAVIAFNDLLAEAAIRVLALRRLTGSVVVVGADADLAACQRIAEGTQSMTVYKPIEQIAAKAAELAVFMARKERFTVHNAISDGSYRVPYYELEPIAVDAGNLRETVIKDGFHLEKDVYRNVLAGGSGR